MTEQNDLTPALRQRLSERLTPEDFATAPVRVLAALGSELVQLVGDSNFDWCLGMSARLAAEALVRDYPDSKTTALNLQATKIAETRLREIAQNSTRNLHMLILELQNRVPVSMQGSRRLTEDHP